MPSLGTIDELPFSWNLLLLSTPVPAPKTTLGAVTVLLKVPVVPVIAPPL
jgi:hypothetical protein